MTSPLMGDPDVLGMARLREKLKKLIVKITKGRIIN